MNVRQIWIGVTRDGTLVGAIRRSGDAHHASTSREERVRVRIGGVTKVASGWGRPYPFCCVALADDEPVRLSAWYVATKDDGTAVFRDRLGRYVEVVESARLRVVPYP